MTGRSTSDRRLLGGLVVAVLGLALVACGGSDESAADTYPYDVSDVGDDLLGPDRRTLDVDGATIAWRFPTSYADDGSDEDSVTVIEDDVLYGLEVSGDADDTPRSAAEDRADELELGDDAIHDVTIDDSDWVAVVDDSSAVGLVALYGTVGDGLVVGAELSAAAALEDVPAERIDELHQTALSIQEGAAG